MSHPKQGSKKWRGMAKQFIRWAINDWNALLFEAGSDFKLVAKVPPGAKVRRNKERPMS